MPGIVQKLSDPFLYAFQSDRLPFLFVALGKYKTLPARKMFFIYSFTDYTISA
jgi:hypothetical protein